MARTLIIIGIVFIALGIVVSMLGRLPGLPRLPGDIYIKKENTTIYVPIVSCLVLSLIINFILYLINSK